MSQLKKKTFSCECCNTSMTYNFDENITCYKCNSKYSLKDFNLKRQPIWSTEKTAIVLNEEVRDKLTFLILKNEDIFNRIELLAKNSSTFKFDYLNLAKDAVVNNNLLKLDILDLSQCGIYIYIKHEEVCKLYFAVYYNKVKYAMDLVESEILDLEIDIRVVADEMAKFYQMSSRRKEKLKALSEHFKKKQDSVTRWFDKPAIGTVAKVYKPYKTTPDLPNQINSESKSYPINKSISKQLEFNELQKACDAVYNGVLTFSRLLQEHNNKIDNKIKPDAQSLDLKILIFLQLCDSNQNGIGALVWNGKTAQLTGILLTINTFMNEVHRVTQYRFHSLNWFIN